MATPEQANPDAATPGEAAKGTAAAGRPSLVRELAGILDRRRTRREDGGQELLARAGVLLSSSLEREATLQAVASLVVPSLADWFALQLFDDAGVLQPVLTMHADPEKVALAEAYHQRWPPGGDADSPVSVVVRTGRPQLVPTVTDEMLQATARDPEHLSAIRALGMTSVILLPLVARDRVFGAMSLVAAESGHHYHDGDLLLAEELARRIAVALDNAHLLAAAREAAERTARLQAVTAGLGRALTPEDVADTVVKEGMAAFQASDGILCLVTEDGRWLEIVRATGLPEQTTREFRRFAIDGPFPLSDAVRSGKPLFLENKASVQSRYPALREANQRASTESWIALPLLSDGLPIGGLAFGFVESRRFSEEDRALGIAFAQQCVQALERARLLDSERRARSAAERLQELTAALSEAATPSAVGEVVMRYGVTALGAYAGVLALEVQGADELELLSSVGYPPQACMAAGRRWPKSAGMPIAEAARTGRPVFVASPEAWGTRYLGGYLPKASSSAAWAAIPIRSRETSRGALLWTFERPREFRDDERSLMSAIARQCAQALDRARLYEAEQQARREAEDARARADEANRAKTEFLAIMSHELRTPLNAISGYAELLEMGIHGPLSDPQRDAIARIQRSQRHLLGLINDVLNFARIDSGHLEVSFGDVPVHETLTGLEALVAPQVRAKRLRYEYTGCDRAITMYSDAEKTQQVLLNLLSNAIKFTPEGGEISVSCVADDELVRVAVADSGPGIAGDKLERIFEPFVQLDAGRTRTHQGTGLGLAISRDLARAMNGDIAVESSPGAGAVFTLTLPRRAPRSGAPS